MSRLRIKLTSKRQATFPVETCRAPGVGPGDTLEVEARDLDGERVWIFKTEGSPDLSWVRCLKGKTTVTNHSMEAVREGIAAGQRKERACG